MHPGWLRYASSQYGISIASSASLASRAPRRPKHFIYFLAGPKLRPVVFLRTIAVLLFALPLRVFAVDLTVHDYAAGDGPADLVSNGVPFAPGMVTEPENIRVLDGPTELAIGV